MLRGPGDVHLHDVVLLGVGARSGPPFPYYLLAVVHDLPVSRPSWACTKAACWLCELWPSGQYAVRLAFTSALRYTEQHRRPRTCAVVRQHDSTSAELTSASSGNCMTSIANWWAAVRYLAASGYSCRRDIFEAKL